MKVWAIFSIANNYDQPENNLEKLYKNKPTFEQLLDFMLPGKKISEIEEEYLIGVVGMLQGKEVRMLDIDYRIEEVEVVDNE